ncbi:uncharacterized protein FA14DRAFT_178145 [Meira miltonrushii]|uniref:1-alkyl-2-acetylglycerophosphocholine esterase n=1 Tax=Meira miltonrushii TaxID=1280837 RepID=A0A316VAV4_9BASI|nr:uncharacterized protein FA14DRAFT_178145 [Meira miltonrushii]PWN34747.1 hypothetical protein FA14DRAFT_178145 [Meira miltonrushii]
MWHHLPFFITILFLLQIQVAAEANQTDNSNDVLLTSQLGPYPVTINEYEIKTNRTDPLAPTPQLRNLMITVHRPASKNFTCPTQNQARIPYAPPEVLKALDDLLLSTGNSSLDTGGAAVAALGRLQILNCTSSDISASSKNPILLFGPGLKATHHVYTGITMASASFGYTVVALDHTYESAAVVFPDGSVNYTSPIGLKLSEDEDQPKGFETIQNIRTADVASVLDAIEKGEIPGIPKGKKQIAMYGHSLGGSTATNAALKDKRIKAAVNLDGTFYGAPNRTTIHKPLLMVGGADEWKPIFSKSRGWKTWVKVDNTEHYGYTDLPQIADLMNVRDKAIPLSLTGTINSQRLQVIVSSYTNHFFDLFLRGEKSKFLQGPRANFPDVPFIGHSQPKD